MLRAARAKLVRLATQRHPLSGRLACDKLGTRRSSQTPNIETDMRFTLAVALLAIVSICTPAIAQQPPAKPNVLFFAVDDLRTDLGCYGHPEAKTPNIDALAKRGMVFRRAYCQQAVCSPSRTSLLTGLRPDSTKVYELVTHFRNTIPEAVSLPQHFRENGYYAVGMGKIFHPGYDDPKAWSEPHKDGP